MSIILHDRFLSLQVGIIWLSHKNGNDMARETKICFTSKSKKLCLHHVFYRNVCLYAVLFLLTQPQFYLFGAWGIDVSWYIAMYFDLMPKESSVFSVAGSAYVQIGENHQRKNQEGEKYCWQNLAGRTYKKLHPAETHKMCSSFWAFVSEIYESMV